MKTYLGNLIERVKSYSLQLDKLENLVDIPWVHLEEDGTRAKYIFRRDGSLLVSRSTGVAFAKWEYITGTNSVLLQIDNSARLYNQGFVTEAVLILKVDGTNDDVFALANEMKVPDLNIEKYIKSIYYKRNGIRTRELYDGQELEVHGSLYIGTRVSIHGEAAPDGKYRLHGESLSYKIQSSRICDVYQFKTNYLPEGKLEVECLGSQGYYVGGAVLLNGVPAPDGKYKIGWLKTIEVKDGELIKH